MNGKFQYFNGIKYTRDDKTGYYLNSTRRKRIHRAVWEFHNGTIPVGHDIHHVDGDKSNNSINNLQLISKSKHATLHGTERAETRYEWMCNNLKENAVPQASEWHRSKEGREWHSQHGREVAKTIKPIEFICKECGKPYFSKDTGQNKFCSNSCKAKWRRKSGLDDVKKDCPVCGKTFTSNKYSKTQTCSRACANRYRKAIAV